MTKVPELDDWDVWLQCTSSRGRLDTKKKIGYSCSPVEFCKIFICLSRTTLTLLVAQASHLICCTLQAPKYWQEIFLLSIFGTEILYLDKKFCVASFVLLQSYFEKLFVQFSFNLTSKVDAFPNQTVCSPKQNIVYIQGVTLWCRYLNKNNIRNCTHWFIYH